MATRQRSLGVAADQGLRIALLLLEARHISDLSDVVGEDQRIE
jgi:hypothetical protein